MSMPIPQQILQMPEDIKQVQAAYVFFHDNHVAKANKLIKIQTKMAEEFEFPIEEAK